MMRLKLLSYAGAVITAALVSYPAHVPASVPPGGGEGLLQGKHAPPPKARVEQKAEKNAVKHRARSWDDREGCRTVVVQYYAGRPLPPGLAKRRALPPGLRRQLRERQRLPRGFDAYLVPVPVELEAELPPLPPHHIRRFAGNDLLVIDVRLNTVSAVISGALVIH